MHRLDLQARKAQLVLQAQLVQPDHKVLLAQRETPETLVRRVLLALQAQQVPLGLRVLRAILATLAQQVQLVRQEPLALQVRRVHKASKVFRVLRVFKDRKAFRVRRATLEIPAQLAPLAISTRRAARAA